MDEEKNGQAQKPENVLSKGAKKLGEQSKKKVFKKVIAVILPILLKVAAGALIIAVLLAAISNVLDKITGKKSKEASGAAISYVSGASSINSATSDASPNRIIVDADNLTENGGYKLTYEFEGDLTEEQQLKKIKADMNEQNEKLKGSSFSESELKIIGVLMYNGLKVEQYNEEELKALVVFVKADIASKSFDLRKKDDIGKEITLDDVRNSDEIFGTLQVHKTTTGQNDGYNETILEYVTYGDKSTPGTFCYMVEQNDESVLNKFSINEDEKIVVAKKTVNISNYIYKDKAGNEIDQTQVAEENRRENINTINITMTTPIEYKKYITRYIVNYGLLSDLLIVTQNVDFCSELAELAFNSKVVINVKEEQVITTSKSTINYTETKLLYDYAKYEIYLQKEITTTWTTVTSGKGSPGGNTTLINTYGWNPSMKPVRSITSSSQAGRLIYEWTYNNTKYQLDYTSTSKGSSWILYKGTENIEFEEAPEEKNKAAEGDLINLNNNHITEKYSDDYTIDEDYTDKEVFEYTVETDSYFESYIHTPEISEVDTWDLKYDKQYESPVSKAIPDSGTYELVGEFPKEAVEVLKTTNQEEINADKHVQEFIEQKKGSYQTNIQCNVKELTVKQKLKTDRYEEYSSTTTTYKFGEEIVDTTDIIFKNVEYVNDEPAFTETDENGNPEIGFLYIYNKYRQEGIDLFLENDAEKSLFELLEEDVSTQSLSEIIKWLLYVYDGIDRGATSYLDKTFRIYDINLLNVDGVVSAFGCVLTREKFIEIALKHNGESVLASLAGDFYDICTSEEYNVNPCFAYASAITESSWGSKAPGHNLFGMGVYNGQNSGVIYGSYADSIKDFCEWTVAAATPGTPRYDSSLSRAEQFATVNQKFIGTPDKNIYAQFCNYMYLGDTHISDEPDFNNPAGTAYYIAHGSTYGAGGRIKIYNMYERGLYEGEYAERCGHPNGSDPTTLQEKADNAQYSIQKRINTAKKIFGRNCLLGSASFPEYNQYDSRWVNYPYGGPCGRPGVPANEGKQKTIGSSGCGCCALAMILSGYTGKAITPDVLTQALDEKFPSGIYYYSGKGSSGGALAEMSTEYGCTYEKLSSRQDALEALLEGYAVLGGETGHYLAFVPVTTEEAAQGYVFRILDSALGHGGLYRSFDEADRVVNGSCLVSYVIYPPE